MFYTLIIAPTTGSRFYKVVIHHRHLYVAVLVSLISVGIIVAGGIWVAGRASLLLSFQTVQKENQALKEQYLSKLKHLQLRLASVEATSDQVRQIAKQIGLELENATEKPGENPGTGGPEELQSFTQDVERMEASLKALKLNLEKEKVRLATTPTGWPVDGRPTDRFGTRRNPFGEGYEFHSGLDLDADYGESVRATADGAVVYAAYRSGYGNLVVIDHGNGITTFYGHLSGITVSVGDSITRGQKIGLAGSTGRSTGYHVHYEIRIGDRPINPLTFAGG
jgi:murein DD-endopeptidase MepM/ murein hydrolase activator NlpD